MSLGSQAVAKAENPFAAAFGISGVVFILLAAGLLHTLRVPLTVFALLVGAAALLWLAFRHPTAVLGSVLAFMPIFPMAFLLAKFFGPSYIGSLEGFDRVVMLVLVFILWLRNGIKLTTPDWFLLACFGLALVRFAFAGKLLPLLSDFNLMIAYAAGRLAVLTAEQEKLWAKRAVWIIAVLAILGMTEIFIIGEAPRTALYLAVATEGMTFGGVLGNAFRATGYLGMREGATTLGPLHFAPLCMAALIVWWVYFRKHIPGAMIAAGLICTVTRSAWFGTALAFPFLATIMGQQKRFLRYVAVGLALFAVSVPVLGLSDYLFATKTMEDPSAEGHARMLSEGLVYVSEHPLGVGPGNAGRWATDKFNNESALNVDDTYLTLAAEYGVPTALCFVGFLLTALRLSWRQRTQVGYAAAGILVGFSAIMVFFIAHDIFALATWIWFPVGLAVRSASDSSWSLKNNTANNLA
jgi:O-Antigen ligase